MVSFSGKWFIFEKTLYFSIYSILGKYKGTIFSIDLFKSPFVQLAAHSTVAKVQEAYS